MEDRQEEDTPVAIAAVGQPCAVVHLHNDLIVWSHPG